MRTLFAPASGPVLRSWRLTRVQTATCGSAGEEVPAELLAQIQLYQNATNLADRPGDSPASRAELRSLLAPPYRGRRSCTWRMITMAGCSASRGSASTARSTMNWRTAL